MVLHFSPLEHFVFDALIVFNFNRSKRELDETAPCLSNLRLFGL